MDDVLTLVSQTITTHDDYGNEVLTTKTRDVLCQIYGVSRNEFYSASQAGLKPEIIARLSDYADYQGEKVAVFHGDEFDIIRTYRGGTSFGVNGSRDGMEVNNIELTLQRKASNG